MNRTRIINKLAYLFLFSLTVLLPYSLSSAAIRPYAGEFLRNALGVRELSLGGAAISLSEGPSAGFWNPANLGIREDAQLEIMHSESFDAAVNFDYLGVLLSPKDYNLAFLFIRNAVDNIPFTNNALLDYGNDGIPGTNDPGESNGRLDDGERLDPSKIYDIGVSEWAGYISVSRKNNSGISWGFSSKLIHQNLYRRKSFGFGVDVAVTRFINNKIRISAVLKDAFTTFIFWDDGVLEQIAPSLSLSADAHLDFKSLNMEFRPVFSLEVNGNEKSFYNNLSLGPTGIYLKYGSELVLSRLIALRLGKDEFDGWHFGIGLNSSLLEIDYGFTPANMLPGNSHLISVNFYISNLRKFLSS